MRHADGCNIQRLLHDLLGRLPGKTGCEQPANHGAFLILGAILGRRLLFVKYLDSHVAILLKYSIGTRQSAGRPANPMKPGALAGNAATLRSAINPLFPSRSPSPALQSLPGRCHAFGRLRKIFLPKLISKDLSFKIRENPILFACSFRVFTYVNVGFSA
jgi:hypothetical protein